MIVIDDEIDSEMKEEIEQNKKWKKALGVLILSMWVIGCTSAFFIGYNMPIHQLQGVMEENNLVFCVPETVDFFTGEQVGVPTNISWEDLGYIDE